MTGASITALAALAGSAIGGLATLATAWLTQNYQDRSTRAAQESARREKVFGEFIDHASRLHIDALMSSLDDPTKMIAIYALIGKLRLFASAETIAEAERVVETIIETYYQPPVNLQDPSTIDRDKYDLLNNFAEVCRAELGYSRDIPRRRYFDGAAEPGDGYQGASSSWMHPGEAPLQPQHRQA